MTAAALAAVLILTGVAACSGGTAADFVRRSGRELTVDGQPFSFVGFDLYDAAATGRYSCRPASRIDSSKLAGTFRYLHDRAGVRVVRFWAYQTYTDGGRDFTGVDAVLKAARANGIRVLPVLEDGPGDCSTGPPGEALSAVDHGNWYSSGYRQPLGSARLSFRDYARLMAAHYRDNPTILGWMLVNEAETTQRDGQGRSVLVDFAGDMAGVVHAADPNHLVTLGTQGNGAPGASGDDFREVYRQSGLDFAEVHDWGRYGSDTEAMPGAEPDGSLPPATSGGCTDRAAKIACSFAIAAELGKPLVVGEAGISADDAAGRDRRAQLLGAKIRAAFADGASGYLVWHYSTAETDGYDVLRAQDDPLFGILHRLAPKSPD